MTSAVLAVWSKTNIKKAYGICVANKDKEIIRVISVNKSIFLNEMEFIIYVFSNNISFTDSYLYTTFEPSENFVSAAKYKKVTNLYWLQNPKKSYGAEYSEAFAKPMLCNFGVVIDLLTQYINIV